MGGLDDLLVAWREEPDAEKTLALCAAVRGPDFESVAREVLSAARSSFACDASVMLAVGRMMLRLGLLADAQAPLALAGKADPTDWRPFLELGRLLLLRGDAARGAQALHRALAMGCHVEELAAWVAMAEELEPLQQTAGSEVVAEEVGHRALPWPDDGSTLAIGDESVSQAAPTDPPPGAPLWGQQRRPPVRGQPLPAAATATRLATALDDGAATGPSGLLQQLERIGLVGGAGRGAADWQEQPRRTAPGVRILAIAAGISALAIVGAYGYAERVRAGRAARAAEIVATVERMHASGRPEQLRAAELGLREVFDLNPSNPRVADLWVENRALAALWYPEVPAGIGDALRRVQTQGASPAREALGRLVLRFGAYDIVGARQLLQSLDGFGEGTATYQLAAAVVLEHSGDPLAASRYRRAVELDSELAPAQIMLARLALLERGARPGRSAAPTLGHGLNEHPIGRCLRRLQWALDPTRDREPPTLPLSEQERALLPRPLRPIPPLVDAVQSIGRQEWERAIEQLEAGLSVAETPAAVTRFGLVALQAGSPSLARRAAYRVQREAPDYPRLAVLAARVGLLEGRLENAERAVAVVNAQRHQLALVHAVASYELADQDGVEVAVRALGADLREHPELRATALFFPVLRGAEHPEADKLQDLAVPAVLWGEQLAVDSALDSGKIDLAQALVRAWGERAQTLGPFAARVARLSRYVGSHERAAEFAAHSLRFSDPAPRALIESVWADLALERPESARGILDAYANVLGPYRRWLDVLVIKAEKSAPNARVRSSRLPLPRVDAPLGLRVLAARALVASGDARASDVVVQLLSEQPNHPELLLAQQELED